jgi:5-methylcytosine-specific restriction endonuclease McrA
MITEFFNVGGVSVHDQFQVWRTNHQDGTFLTLVNRTSANLHGARCLHLGGGPPYFLLEDGLGSLTIKRKLCGSEEELLAWATEHGVSVNRCRHCLRDKLITNGQVKERTNEIRLPEEVPNGSTYGEGNVQRIQVNRYERDPRAREECIKHYGTACCLCGFDFVATYGEVMGGFTHVHHLIPLSTVGAGYEVDPIEDLRPVCPNCHAVLHRREPPYSLDEVRKFLQARRK